MVDEELNRYGKYFALVDMSERDWNDYLLDIVFAKGSDEKYIITSLSRYRLGLAWWKKGIFDVQVWLMQFRFFDWLWKGKLIV